MSKINNIKKNSIHHVKIDDISNMGYGVCRIGNTVTFVAGAVDGDELEVKIIKTAKSYNAARIERIITPSQYRSEISCAVSAKCGGCVYRGVTYEHELELKRSYIINAFKKAGLTDIAVAPVQTAGQPDGYRNKVQYPVGDDFKIGYYAPYSHNIVECGMCLLQSRAFDNIMRYVSDFIKTKRLSEVRHIYLRYAKATGEVMLCLVIRSDKLRFSDELVDGVTKMFPEVVSIQLNVNKSDGNVILGDKCINLYGKDYIEDILCGLTFRISALSFYQVNHDGAELLYGKVRELAQLKGGESVLDLYCGAGTIGLYLAKNADIRLTGIEVIPEAVENAVVNAKRNGILNAQFICGDAGTVGIGEYDAVVVDPPRKGLTPELISRIAAISPERVVYVSCDCDTMARDIAVFREKGYTASSAAPVDMFPRTGHVETVVLLSKCEIDSK